jgi:hypothetical protein
MAKQGGAMHRDKEEHQEQEQYCRSVHLYSNQGKKLMVENNI